MTSLLDRWRAWREARQARQQQQVLAARAIPDELWLDTLRAFPFLARRPLQDLLALRTMSTLFLDRKEFSTAGELTLTDEMAVAVAAQACVPVLHLPGGLDWYDRFVGIVMTPHELVVQRHWQDEAGVMHTDEEVLAGEARSDGPMMLSWHDVQRGGVDPEEGYDVVIHEFVHIIDMAAGGHATGTPPLPDRAALDRWQAVMAEGLARHTAEVEADLPTWLDPYAAHGPEEFFPVVSEAFFVSPEGLAAEFPEVYELLRDFYRQDPLAFRR